MECSQSNKTYDSAKAFMRDAFNAPLLQCSRSKTGHCRFRFKVGNTTACAMGCPDGNYGMCLKYLSWPDHETNRKWNFNQYELLNGGGYE